MNWKSWFRPDMASSTTCATITDSSRRQSRRTGGGSMAIKLKTPEQIERMRAAGRLVHRVLQHCREICKPGVTTRFIDEEADRLIREAGARGLFKNYPTYRPGEGFPSNLCISVNDVVVHGIASDTTIRDGDIVGI